MPVKLSQQLLAAESQTLLYKMIPLLVPNLNSYNLYHQNNQEDKLLFINYLKDIFSNSTDQTLSLNNLLF
jgi:hypothetical protein